MLQLKILNIENIIYEGIVTMINVPGIEGNFQVLQNHDNIISVLKNGYIDLLEQDSKEIKKISIHNGGAIEVRKNIIKILVF